MILLQNQDLQIELCAPGEYYQGTRFDYAGVFRRIIKNGYVLADEWFDTYSPTAHDAVCGCSEEFVTVQLDGIDAGDLFVKPGVGLLRRPDNNPYDWFHLYEIVQPGIWEVKQTPTSATFIHTLEGYYKYEKTIRITSANTFSIEHSMKWLHKKPLCGHQYNHHFFTFGGSEVGVERKIDFPFPPTGNWRMPYSNVALTPNGIRFNAPITETPSVYMGNLHNAQGATPYAFNIAEKEHQVTINSNEPVDFYVFWSNPKVACIEPYIPIQLKQGESKNWEIFYTIK